MPTCEELFEPDKAASVHALMVRLRGKCPCSQPEAKVYELLRQHGAPQPERLAV